MSEILDQLSYYEATSDSPIIFSAAKIEIQQLRKNVESLAKELSNTRDLVNIWADKATNLSTYVELLQKRIQEASRLNLELMDIRADNEDKIEQLKKLIKEWSVINYPGPAGDLEERTREAIK
jgi:chromosome segregation ATPase